MDSVSADDFYEDDEPAEEIRKIFEAGPKGLTGNVRGWTQTLDPMGTSAVVRFTTGESTNETAGRLVTH